MRISDWSSDVCSSDLGLVARIVLATTSAGGVVLDPYMGAGTTAVVARDNGRHFLGAEMDERYHSVALRRLDGRPDQNGYFPNLKTLRAYVACTGEPIERFLFDLQTGKTASEGTNARPEDHTYEIPSLMRIAYNV